MQGLTEECSYCDHRIHELLQDKIQMLDIYLKHRRPNGINQPPEFRTVDQFIFKKFLQPFNGKNFNHVIDEAFDSFAPSSALVSYRECRQAKQFIDLAGDFNTLVFQEFDDLENSNTSANQN